MPEISVKVDVSAIKKKFEKYVESNQKVADHVDKKVKKIFQRSHSALMREFKNHSVTKELVAGAQDPGSSSNISNTLQGYGNLFSFLGFYFAQEPTKPLEELLYNAFGVRRTTRRFNNLYYRVKIPTEQEIRDVTPMDWAPEVSWAYAVENGEFNGGAEASHYIFKEAANSRSTRGLQLKFDYSNTSFTPIGYITPILENFRERMNEVEV